MARATVLLGLLLTIVACTSAKVYFEENFDAGWEDRWVQGTSKEKQNGQGPWKNTAGKWHGDADDKGLQTGEDYRFYEISAAIKEPFTNRDKDLVLQYTVKHEQQLDCGGGYIKLTGPGIKQKTFNGDEPYYIMFGPDICGSTKRTHIIFTYNGVNLLSKKDMKTETDQMTHLYTLIVHPDNTFDFKIDMKTVDSGKLEDNWDFLKPKEIKDPEQSKPKDWVDTAKIADPADVKPEEWDEIPKEIADPEAEKPEDWDDEADGEWQPPMMPNPEFKGEWKPKMIDNPDYNGPWVHPMIANPDYKEDKDLYAFDDISFVGFEIWQVKAGTIFDNILVTDSVEEADAAAEKSWKANQSGEKKMFDEIEAARRAEEEDARKEAEAAKAAENTEDDDDDDEDLANMKKGGKDEL